MHHAPSDRLFTERPQKPHETTSDQAATSGEICHYIYSNLLGSDHTFSTPFGRRRSIYTDYTASGKSLQFIEEYITREVLPLYGNTHSTISVTAEQTTLYAHEARDVIRNAVGAGDKDVVLYVVPGSGCTGAVNLLAHSLKLEEAPVIIHGPLEHHSNLLPWREMAHEVFGVGEDEFGLVDLEQLAQQLKKAQALGRQVIGVFSACSNVTGVLSDVDRISSLIHSYSGLVFWDYAAAAPYVNIDMNPVRDSTAWKDAVFFSGHKFVGGPQTPGVLVAKKSLFRHSVPEEPGGGTVFFVREDQHRYLRSVEYREQGGTPDIVGQIRLALCMQLKQSVSVPDILSLDERNLERALKRWTTDPGIVVLGCTAVPRLPIISFLIRHQDSGLFLHHAFISAVLNDVFGIQTRAGCLCAGPYVQRLLGIDDDLAAQFERILLEDPRLDRDHLRRIGEYSQYEMLRPGVVRLSLPYFLPLEVVDFVVEAVLLTSKLGWKLLPQYRLNYETGEWHHKDQPVFTGRKWLGNLRYTHAGIVDEKACTADEERAPDIAGCLKDAERIFEEAAKVGRHVKLSDERNLFLTPAAFKLKWFLLSIEAQAYLDASATMVKVKVPFEPRTYRTFTDAQRWNRIRSNYLPSGLGDLSSTIAFDLSNQAKTIDTPTEPEICAQLTENRCDTMKPTTSKEVKLDRQDWSKRQIVRADPNTTAVRYKWHSPPAKIFKPLLQAVKDHEMIRHGDRVLVCLSGGKDSLSLLHCLHQYQFVAASQGVVFELGAVTVDPGSDAYNPRPLIEYLAGLNCTYFYEEQRIVEAAKGVDDLASICAFCSRMKRGRIYAAARTEGWNVLAFGQHLDDLAESFLMSAFHNGALRTMKAHYTVREGDLRVIRPLCYVREKQLRVFAERSKLPVIAENCPACFDTPTQRHKVKQLLAGEEVLFPALYDSLLRALKPLMAVRSVDSVEMRSDAVKNIMCNGDGSDVVDE